MSTTKKEQVLSKIDQLENEVRELRKIAQSIDQKKNVDDLDTWESICEYSGRDPKKLPDVSMYSDKDKKYAIAAFKLPIIYEVRNNGWEANYDDKKQIKWTPYFQKVSSGRSSGFVYSYSNYGYDGTFTSLGSRFASPTKEQSASVAEDFLELWNDLLLYNK